MAEIPRTWVLGVSALLLLLLVAVIALSVFMAIAFLKHAKRGRSGSSGNRGRRGATGAVGAQGFDGPTGPTGPEGIPGTATNTGADGATGPTGPEGIPGSATNTGATGPTGPTGPQGIAGAESIIPFASSSPVSLTTVLGGGGGADLGALVAFGGSVSSVDVSGGTVDITGSPAQQINEAFDAPRAGTITSIAATYSNVTAVALGGGTGTVHVQLFHAAAASNVFSPLVGVEADIMLTGTLVLGTTGSALVTGLAVPVIAGDRYMLVVFVTTAGVATSVTLNGYVSAGVGIA